MPNIRRLAILSVFLLPLGCSRCAGPSRNAEEFIAPDATFYISVPSLGVLADHVSAMKATARNAGNDTVVEWLADLAGDGILGFDPFTRAGQKQAGLDPDRSLAIGGAAKKGGYAALPYTDLDRLLATVQRLGPQRSGADVKEERKIGDRKVTVFSHAAGGEPAYAYTTQDGFLLLGMGATSDVDVAAAATRRLEGSAAKAGPFVAAKAKVGARDLYAFIPTLLKGGLPFLPRALNAGLSVAEDEIALRVFVPVDSSQAQAVAQAFKTAPTPVARLPAGQPAYLKGSLDWSSIVKTLSDAPVVGAIIHSTKANLQGTGIDMEKDLFDNIEPGFAAAIGLSPTAQLMNVMQVDPSKQNPFKNYTVVALGKVKDAARANATFENLAKALDTLGDAAGMSIKVAHDSGKPAAYTVNYRLGEAISWMVQGNDLIVVGGLSSPDLVLADLAKGASPLTRDRFPAHAADALFSDSGLALAVDFPKLTEEADKLSAGSGPGSFVARAIVNNGLKRVNHFRPVLAISPGDGELRVDLATNVK